ncbi:MAG: response regulator [Acidimicrobiales bacterium]
MVLADDHELLRASLATLVDAEDDLAIVGQAGSGDVAVEVVRSTRPDIALLDIRMPGMDGIQATRRICAEPELDQVRVVVLTMFDLDEYVFAALDAGAAGFLLKDVQPEGLLAGIRAVHAGDSLVASRMVSRLVAHGVRSGPGTVGRRASTTGPAPALTPRETEVLTLIGLGRSNTELARELYIGESTVKTHVSRLLTKLGARDRVHLVIAAYDLGLVVPGETDHGSTRNWNS